MRDSQIRTSVLFASIMILAAPVDLRGQPATAPDNSRSGQPISASPPVQENPAFSEQAQVPAPSFAEAICLALARVSLDNDLPIDFFTRLIWQESHFDPQARSYAGAQGIAQFMPATAQGRGLADPFDPQVAVRASARFLHELRAQFGNLGLAAAAYNAGHARVQAWLGGHARLPAQTRAYVRIITGRAVEHWVGVDDEPEDRMGNTISCDEIARLLSPGRRKSTALTALTSNLPQSETPDAAGPWGLQLAGNRSESAALARYRDLQRKFPSVLGTRAPLVIRRQRAGPGSADWYVVRVAESTRERANQLCSRLEAMGGKCIVLKN